MLVNKHTKFVIYVGSIFASWPLFVPSHILKTDRRPPPVARVGILVNNAINVTFGRIHLNPLITSFELMEVVLTVCSVSLRLIVIYRMSPSKINELKTGTFYEELYEYVEKLYCASGRVIIPGGINFFWGGY